VAVASTLCVVSAYADEYEIIIEKNLFHDQRQKWKMEKSQAKGSSSQAGARDQEAIDSINLFGTVIKDSQSYAVMRVTEKASSRRSSKRSRDKKKAAKRKSVPGNKHPYAVGDFISGFMVAKIQPESVLLQDPYDSKQYEVFMNDSETERTAVRTEIPEDKPEKPVQASKKDRKSKRKLQEKAAKKSGVSKDAIRRRIERDEDLLSNEKGEASSRQAERDMENLEPLTQYIDPQDMEDMLRLRGESEKLRKRK